MNREVSWLAFNSRVLQEAGDDRVPLVERVRFLGIFSNNLDEFFRVRVASLRRMAQLNPDDRPKDERDPMKRIKEIHKIILGQKDEFDSHLRNIIEELRVVGINVIDHTELTAEQEEYVGTYFDQKVRPLLSPVMVKKGQKFHPLRDDRIYFAVLLTIEDAEPEYAVVEVPHSLKRFLIIPGEAKEKSVMFLDDVVRFKLSEVFAIFNPIKVEAFTIKITRDAELDIDDDITRSAVQKMSRSVKRRKEGEYVRFLYDDSIDKDLLELMKSLLNLTDNENIIAGGRYHNKRDFMSFPDFDRKELVFKSCPPLEHPALRRSKLMFEQIQEKDILLHYPYHDFGYIIDLLREATLDPLVTRIRITLYRVAKESRIVAALVNAARNGKRVMVVIEIQARFDEQVNIQAGDRLQEAGCKIIFGVPGLKVHTKMLLITRRVGEKTVRYAHIGTGNFHERNAKVYTDLALITANQSIGKEVKKVFEMTEKNYMRPVYKHLLVSPINSRRRLEAMLQNEVNNAKEGKEAWIKLKLNNLVDNKMIKRLYKASEAGVKIQLIVRGVCALVPGIPGYSENIEVVSIVGRYLEHARILMFCNAGKTLYYLTSADIMTRNLDYRIEVGVPIYDAEVQQSLARVFDLQWSDNVNARLIDKGLNNFYRTALPGEASMNSQEEFYNLYKGQA